MEKNDPAFKGPVKMPGQKIEGANSNLFENSLVK
jgi:hypothetical protein